MISSELENLADWLVAIEQRGDAAALRNAVIQRLNALAADAAELERQIVPFAARAVAEAGGNVVDLASARKRRA